MPSNYRLPLKNFENSRWDNNRGQKLTKNYQKNTNLLAKLPFLGLSVILISLLIAVTLFLGQKNNQNLEIKGVKSIPVVPIASTDETVVSIDNCEFVLDGARWNGSKNCPGYLDISDKSINTSSMEVSKSPIIFITPSANTLLGGINLLDTKYLINPILEKNLFLNLNQTTTFIPKIKQNSDQNELLSTSINPFTKTNFKLIDECKKNTSCKLVEVVDENNYYLLLDNILPSLREKEGFIGVKLEPVSSENAKEGLKDGVKIIISSNVKEDNRTWLFSKIAKSLIEI
jgi:hypothetical protein